MYILAAITILVLHLDSVTFCWKILVYKFQGKMVISTINSSTLKVVSALTNVGSETDTPWATKSLPLQDDST